MDQLQQQTASSLAQEDELLLDQPIEDMPAPSRRGGWILALAWLLSLAWIGAAAAWIYPVAINRPDMLLDVATLAQLAAGLGAPLTAIWLMALVSARIHPTQDLVHVARIRAAEKHFTATALMAQQQIAHIDSQLLAAQSRVADLHSSLAQESTAMDALNQSIEQRANTAIHMLNAERERLIQAASIFTSASDTAAQNMGRIIEKIPETLAQADQITRALEKGAAHNSTHMEKVESWLNALWARNEAIQQKAEAAVQTLHKALHDIDSNSDQGIDAIERRAEAMKQAADQAFARASEALEATRAGIEAQSAHMLEAINQGRSLLADLDSDSSKIIAARLDRIAEQAKDMAEAMAIQEERSAALGDTLERSMQIIDVKLGNAVQATDITLNHVVERLSGVRDQIHAVSEPLTGTRDTVREIQATLGQLQQEAQTAMEELQSRLPVTTAEARSHIQHMHGDIIQVGEALTFLHQSAQSLSQPLGAHRQEAERTRAALQSHVEGLEHTAQRITTILEEARQILGTLETDASGTALSVSTKLVESLNRVREVSAQSAGVMRQALEGVVEEISSALSVASSRTLRDSFTQPAIDHVNAIDQATQRSVAAANQATERLSRQMALLSEAIVTVETRVGEADARVDGAAREDLARQSNLLIEALNSAAIDIAKTLSADISDQAWQEFMKGDRSVFTRRSVALLSSNTSKTIARYYEQEPEFREAVRRYIHDFEAMMRRVIRDRDGNALSVALLSSDVGKLYVALAQAVERLRS